MSDLATLGLRIEQTGAEPTKRAVDGVTSSVQKAEQATKSLAQAQQALVGTSKQETAEFLKRQQAFKDETQRIREATAAQAALAASSEKAAAAHNTHHVSLSRLETSLGSFVGHAAGVPPVVDRIVESLGGMVAGGAVMVGVFAGLSLIAVAWEKITEKAREAKKAQDDAIESLRKMQAVEDAGPAGQTAINAGLAVKRQRDLEARIAAQQGRVNAFAPGSEGRDIAQKVLAELQKEYDEEAKIAQRGVQTVARIEQEANASALAERIQFNAKDKAAREAALDLLARDRARYAQLLTLPESVTNSEKIAKVASEIKELNDALFPKDKDRSSGRDAAQQRSLSNIAEQEERRVAAAQALYEAALKGKDVYDKEVHTQALLNSLLETEQRIRADFLDKNGKQKAGTEALMAAEIARARAAVQAQDDLARKTRDTLDAQKKAEEEAKKAAAEGKRIYEEARREQERRARELQRSVAGAFEQGIEDFAHGVDPFRAFEDALKRAIIHAFAEALAAKAIAKAITIFGGTTADGAHGGIADASVVMRDAEFYKKLGKGAGAAVGGFALGNSIGQATGSGVAGAVGGAASGFMLGNAILPGIGGVVGGLAGFVGGILGAGDAAKAAAERLKQAREAFQNAFDAAKAQVNKDDLGQQIAAAHQYFDQLRDLAKAQSSIIDRILNNKNLGSYAEKLREIQALEDRRIEQLKEEAAAQQRYFREDLDVRILRAQGKDKEADAQAFRNQQARERDEFTRTHQMVDDPTTSADDAQVAQNIADYNKLVYAQSLELQKNTAAINTLTSTMLHNAPTGFKYQPYTYEFGVPRPRAPLSMPGFPQTPNNPPQLSKGSSGGTVNVTINLPTTTTRDQVKAIAVEVKKVVVETLGSNADISQGWGLLA